MLAQERETGLPEQLQDHVPFKYSMCYLDLHTTASISQLSENIAEENKEKQREGEMTQEMTLKKLQGKDRVCKDIRRYLSNEERK